MIANAPAWKGRLYILTEDDVDFCDDYARRRKIVTAGYRPDPRFDPTKDAELKRLLSVRGELAFSRIFKLPMDLSTTARRGGSDFRFTTAPPYAKTYKIDVKCSPTGSGSLTVQRWKDGEGYRSDIYVHTSIDPPLEIKITREPTPRDWRRVCLHGWAWAEEVFKTLKPADKAKGTSECWAVYGSDLRNLDELEAIIKGAPEAYDFPEQAEE